MDPPAYAHVPLSHRPDTTMSDYLSRPRAQRFGTDARFKLNGLRFDAERLVDAIDDSRSWSVLLGATSYFSFVRKRIDTANFLLRISNDFLESCRMKESSNFSEEVTDFS